MSKVFAIFLLLFTVAPPLRAETEAEILAGYNRIMARPTTMQGLSYEERQRLFRDVSRNAVAGLGQIGEYDPTGEIGFCFGRAMAGQLVARRMGLDPASVKKLFVVGDLRQGDKPEWRFHVTMVGKGRDGKWYAFDPIMTPPLGTGVMPAEAWIDIVQKTWDKPRADKKYEAKYYLTDGDVIVPEIRDPKSPIMQFETFSPETNSDFAEISLGGRKVFTVDPKAQEKYFVAANGSPDGRFRFKDISIGDRNFDYRNYFAKLVDSVINPVAAPPTRAAAATAQVASTAESIQLFSPRFVAPPVEVPKARRPCTRKGYGAV